MNVVISILALAVVLGVLVFVHEAGHFVAAKWAGIYVHRFSLGLGAPIRALTFRRGETEYSISWLPLGGYVKMASREEDAASAMLEGGAGLAPVPPDRVFEAKPVWKRMVVILAGVAMNMVFAWVLYTAVAAAYGRPVLPTTRVGYIVPELATDQAAPLAQLEPGDRIVAVSGDSVHTWEDVVEKIQGTDASTVRIALADGRVVTLPIGPTAVGARIRAASALLPYRPAVVDSVVSGRPAGAAGVRPGDSIIAINGHSAAQIYDVFAILDTSPARPVTLTVDRNGRTVSIPMTSSSEPGVGLDGKPRTVGRVGIAFRVADSTQSLGPLGAIRDGTERTVSASTFLVRTVQGLLTRRVAASTLGGPILIAQQAGEVARLGLDSFLAFMALISVNLAVLNLLPVPVLDGGQFLLLVAEGVMRRPVPLRIRERLIAVGLVLVVLLMGLAFSNDIRRLLGLL
ncbi:MAG TPA: RIP metalloprotease RseP [Gemmatimonadales bacterium]|nr:RIP metalloprotease RseP [Gemmatimonadales bacterium]